MFCRKCGAEIPTGAVVCSVCNPPQTLASESQQCTSCGKPVPLNARFCKSCGATLAPPAPSPVRTAASSPISPLAAQSSPHNRPTTARSPEPPLENCPACGELIPVSSKFCKRCGQSRISTLTQPSSLAPSASRPTSTAPASSAPIDTDHQSTSTTGASKPSRVSTSRSERPMYSERSTWPKYVAISTIAVIALGGLAFGYSRFRKHSTSSTQAVDTPSAAPSSGPEPPAVDAQPSTPSTSSPGTSSQETSATPAPHTDLLMGAQPVPSTTANEQQPSTSTQTSPQPKINSIHRSESALSSATPLPPKPSMPPPYQQARESSQQAFAAGRYVEPTDNSALYWARLARQQGDPTAAQLEDQVFDRIMILVQSARNARDYQSATDSLAKLAPLFPDRQQIPQMLSSVREDQAAYNRQLETQRIDAQTKRFSVRHRHISLLGAGSNAVYYCAGQIAISPDGTVKYDCAQTNDPSGRCDHVSIAPGSLKQVKVGYGDSIRLSTKGQGNFDFYGESAAIQAALQASGAQGQK